MKNFKRSLILLSLSLSLMLSACNKEGTPATGSASNPKSTPGSVQGGSDSKKPGTGNTADPASCSDAWNAWVAANPKGLIEEHEITNTMKMGNEMDYTSKSLQKTKVLESSQELLKTTETMDVISPFPQKGEESITSMTRTEFLAACNKGIPMEGSDEFEITVLEQRREKIQVKAGTFDCLYTKSKMNPKSRSVGRGEILRERWTAGAPAGMESLGFVVKSVSKTMMAQEGVTYDQVTLMELVRRK